MRCAVLQAVHDVIEEETSQDAGISKPDAAMPVRQTDEKKNTGLADSLVCTAVNQFRRAVGGQKNEAFAGQPGLNQCRIKICHRRTGGDNHRHRQPVFSPVPAARCASPRSSKWVTDKFVIGGSSQCQRC